MVDQSNRSSLMDRVRARSGLRPNASPSASTENKERLPYEVYFDRVRSDLDVIDEACEYYRRACLDAGRHITAIGHLETLGAETPGLTFFYQNILVDCQQIRRWLEEILNIERAKKHKWLLTAKEAKDEYGDLKTTEANKWTDTFPDIIRLINAVRLTAFWEHRLEAVAHGFANRSIMISKIVTIRQEGLQDVWINPTQETRNV